MKAYGLTFKMADVKPMVEMIFSTRGDTVVGEIVSFANHKHTYRVIEVEKVGDRTLLKVVRA